MKIKKEGKGKRHNGRKVKTAKNTDYLGQPSCAALNGKGSPAQLRL